MIMQIYGLPLIDVITIIVYFAIVLMIGYWCSRHIKNQEDYFLAGRRFGRIVQIFATFSQGTSAESGPVQTALVVRNGMAGFWNTIFHVVFETVYWFIPLWYRRMRCLTLGDFFEERYKSKGMAAFYSIVSSIFFMLCIGMALTGISKTVSAITTKPVEKLSTAEQAEYQQAVELEQLEEQDAKKLTESQRNRLQELRLLKPRKEFSYINETVLMWVAAVIIVIYAVMGGLEAAFLTDTLQGTCIIILSLLMLPFSFFKINEVYGGSGLSGVIEAARSNIPEAAFDVWGSPLMVDFTWYYIIVLNIMIIINVTVLANQVTVTGSAKDEHAARFGFAMGQYVRRSCYLFWGVTAFLLLILYGGVVKNPDYMWGHACRELLGPLNIGLVGLMIACLLAAMMSTGDALMLTAAGLMTHNLFRPLWPNRSEGYYVWVGRLCSAIVLLGAIAIAMQFDNLVQMLKFLWEFNNVLAASFVVGLKWRRATRTGAWSSMVGSAMLFLFLPVLIPMIPGVRTNPYLLKTTSSVEMSRTYTARQVDVEHRQDEIEQWRQMDPQDQTDHPRPEPLVEGEEFTKVYPIPKRSIFFKQELKVNDEGQTYGSGMLNIELVMIDKLGRVFGYDLANNPYALNETIRLATQTIVPFVIIIVVSLMTKPDDKKQIDRFYVKMKTPVEKNKQQDAKELEISYANPTRYDHMKLFPGTNLEFEKFTKEDIKGVILFGSLAGLLLAAFFAFAWIGKG